MICHAAQQPTRIRKYLNIFNNYSSGAPSRLCCSQRPPPPRSWVPCRNLLSPFLTVQGAIETPRHRTEDVPDVRMRNGYVARSLRDRAHPFSLEFADRFSRGKPSEIPKEWVERGPADQFTRQRIHLVRFTCFDPPRLHCGTTLKQSVRCSTKVSGSSPPPL